MKHYFELFCTYVRLFQLVSYLACGKHRLTPV